MKLRILFLIFFISSIGLYGQDTLEYKKFGYDKLSIGVSPSSLLNSIEAFQMSVDFGLNSRVRLSSEIGYIFRSAFAKNSYGYRLRPSIEALFYTADDFGFQIGGFCLIRNFTENRAIRVFHRERYYEYIPVMRSKKVFGIGGSLAIVSQFSEKIKLETGAGLGFGNLIISDNKEVDNFFRDRFTLVPDSPGKYDFTIIFFNINFSYSIFE